MFVLDINTPQMHAEHILTVFFKVEHVIMVDTLLKQTDDAFPISQGMHLASCKVSDDYFIKGLIM